MSPERHVRTRLYFTSESHVHSLLSILRYGALCDVSRTTYITTPMNLLVEFLQNILSTCCTLPYGHKAGLIFSLSVYFNVSWFW